VHPFSVATLRDVTTPGTTAFSMPLYNPSVFSRTAVRLGIDPLADGAGVPVARHLVEARRLQHPARGVRDLRTDAVAGDEDDGTPVAPPPTRSLRHAGGCAGERRDVSS
jgi:hypothetical protein